MTNKRSKCAQARTEKKVSTQVLLTDSRGVSLIKRLAPVNGDGHLFVKYPEGYKFEEEDIPLQYSRKVSDGASNMLMLGAVMASMNNQSEIDNFDSMTLTFLEMALNIQRVKEEYLATITGRKSSSVNTALASAAVDHLITNSDSWENRVSKSLLALEDSKARGTAILAKQKDYCEPILEKLRSVDLTIKR